jgi:hypothetical protein
MAMKQIFLGRVRDPKNTMGEKKLQCFTGSERVPLMFNSQGTFYFHWGTHHPWWWLILQKPAGRLVVLGLPSDLLCLAESATNDAFCSA